MGRLTIGATISVVVLLVSPVLLLLTPGLLLGLGASVLTVFGLWQLGRCHHPRPLSLLPPVVGRDGERTAAQWFCGNCGKTWPVDLERARPPVQVFTGHDETKARESARRASAYEGRLRELGSPRSTA